MEEIKFIEKAIKSAYKKCISNTKKDVFIKNHSNHSYDFATSCDIAVEEYLRDSIKKKYPNDNIIGEEVGGDELQKGRTWIIDPIDGTINFYYNIPMWCIQLAFVVDGECKFSIIYCPNMNEMYIATEGNVTINGKISRVNPNIENSQAIVNMCDIIQKNKKLLGFQQALFKNLAHKVSKIKMFGSAGYEFAFVASNRIHAYLIMNNNIWDWLPGMFLCKQAGCSIIERDVAGTKLVVACANDDIKVLIEAEIDKYFKTI